LNEIDVSGALIIGGDPTRRQVSYPTGLEADRVHTAQATATDTAGRSSTRTWTFDTYDPTHLLPHPQLELAGLGVATQSGGPASPSPADRAIDANPSTFSETTDEPASYWELELTRAVVLTRIELVTPAAPAYEGVLEGLLLQLTDLRDQVLLATTISGVASDGTWSLSLPAATRARLLRLSLEPDQVNGAGDRRVALAEVRLFGDPSPFHGPLALGQVALATQSSTASTANAAPAAIDGDPGTFSQTEDLPDSYWRVVLDRTRPIQRVELVNRLSNTYAARMQGLTLRILGDQSDTVASASVSNPGSGGTWHFEPPPGTRGRQLWVGLEDGAVNGLGDRVVSLAEVNLLTAENYALNSEAYSIRFVDSLPPAAAANDGSYATYAETTDKTVDAYWETDLGATRALYSVRAVALDGGINQIRLSHATVRLFDADHRSVFAQHLAGDSATFDVHLPGPLLARYVRVGFENKERSHPTGDIEWWLRLREVQAFGRPAEEVGLLEFTATPAQLAAGETTRLQWRQADLYRLDLYPGIGSVGAAVDAEGTGELLLAPAISTEYLLVGSNHNGNFVRHLTVEVDEQKLPARLSEFVASNRLSFRDGSGAEPDWIELHNPNRDPLNLTGYGLSDNPERPMKWIFPAVSVPPHGYLIVFASGRETPFDEAGFLPAPDGVTVVDALHDYPPQREDLAYGRTPDGEWAFLEPTPGAPNLATAYMGWLEPLTFSHDRGFHSRAFQLTLGNPNPGAELFYSLDGSEPSLPYVEPIPVTESRTIRAAVRRPGYRSPRTQTHTYLFLDQVVASPVMNRAIADDPRYRDRLRKGLSDLPTLALGVPDLPHNAHPPAEYDEREGSVEIFWPDGTTTLQQNCGVYRYGGAWTLFAKRGYRLKFRADYGARKLRAPLFQGFDRGFPVQDRFPAERQSRHGVARILHGSAIH